MVTDGQLRLVPGVTKVELKEVAAPRCEPSPGRGLVIMNVAEIFIRRPVMTTLVMLGILMFGIMGYRLLPVSDLPNVDFPTILVSASLPGATPDTMASAVAMPLEKQFSTIAGVDSMTSSSTQGSTQITLQFNLSRNLDAAAQDVQSMIAKAARDLPQNLPSPPSYQKVNPADQPILVSDAEFADAAAFRCGRIRRDADGAAHLHGQRRGPGERVRGAEVCGPRQARSQGAGQPSDRH